MCVDVVLSYVKSADGGRLCCRLGLVGRLVVDQPKFAGFPWRGHQLPHSLHPPFHGRQHLSNSARVPDGLGVVVVHDVLSCASFHAYVHSNTPPGHSRADSSFFRTGLEPANLIKKDETDGRPRSSCKLVGRSAVWSSHSHSANTCGVHDQACKDWVTGGNPGLKLSLKA